MSINTKGMDGDMNEKNILLSKGLEYLILNKSNLSDEEIIYIIENISVVDTQKFFNKKYSHILEYLRVSTGNKNFFGKIVEDDSMTTMCMYIKLGNMKINKTFFLKCCFEHDGLSRDFFEYCIHHENNHYYEIYNPNFKDWLYVSEMESYKKFMLEIDEYIKTKYKSTSNIVEFLVAGFFNLMDDIYVNSLIQYQEKRYLIGGELDQKIQDAYRKYLFPCFDFSSDLDILSLGNFLLNKIMRPNDNLTVNDNITNISNGLLPKVYKWIDLQKKGFNKGKNGEDIFYGAKRYNRFYKPLLWPIIKELLEKDIKNLLKDKDLLEALKKHISKNGLPHYNKDGKPTNGPKGDDVGNSYGYFKNQADDAGNSIEGGSNFQNKQMDEATENKNENKPVGDKIAEMNAKNASRLAEQIGTSLDDVMLFDSVIEKNEQEIEIFAKAIWKLLVDDTENIEKLIIETKKEKGGLIVPDLIDQIPQLIDNKVRRKKITAFEKRYILEILIPKLKTIYFRFLVDNSGSMANLLVPLKSQLIISLSSLERVKNRLKDELEDEIKDGSAIFGINVGVLKFGNEGQAAFIQNTKNIINRNNPSDFKIDTLRVLGHINASEGTVDSDGWKLIDKDISPGELNGEFCSINIEITDGFTASGGETDLIITNLTNRKIPTFCIIINNDVALDNGFEMYLSDEIKNMIKKDGKLSPHEQSILDRELQEAKQKWQNDNKLLLENNPSSNIWNDRLYPLDKDCKGLPLILLSILRSEVLNINKK